MRLKLRWVSFLQLSPAILGGLHNMARSIESRSYTDGLNIHTHIVSNSNFSETSAFMPVLKVVLTQANKLGVWYPLKHNDIHTNQYSLKPSADKDQLCIYFASRIGLGYHGVYRRLLFLFVSLIFLVIGILIMLYINYHDIAQCNRAFPFLFFAKWNAFYALSEE